MSALNPNDYVYLWHPALQMLDKNGKPLVNGYVMVNISDTTGIPAQTYADWNGTENAKKIMLDSLGRAVCIVSDDYRYDMYVYNKYNALEYSALNLSGSGEGGSSNLHFSSSDGSIIINRSGDHVDLRVNTDEKTFGIITGSGLNQDDSIDFDVTQSGNINVQDGSLSLEPGMLYHVTLELKFENATVGDEYAECEILDAAAIRHKFTLDTSRELEYKELSWDLTAINEYAKFVATIPESYSITDAKLYIHKVNSLTVSGSGGATYEAGTGISIVENTISVDTSVVPLKTDLSTVAFSGSYNDLTDKPTIPGQVQSDWTETDTSASSYIQHKPNLATVATSGSYNDLSNKPSIPAAQVNSDWNSSSGVSEILNKPNLAAVATSGSYNDLSNKPSIPAAQVNSDWNASSGVAQILNKPNLATVATSGSYNDLSNKPTIPTKTSDLTNDSGFITSAEIPPQQQADWNETNTSDPSYIQNKPTIPAAQVNSDWNASSGVAEILNKPTLAAVATSGSYNDLSNTPTIPDGVPTVTSSDDGKVLTASYSGGTASYSWQTAGGGGGGSDKVKYIQYGDTSLNFATIFDEIDAGNEYIVCYHDNNLIVDVYFTLKTKSISRSISGAGIEFRTSTVNYIGPGTQGEIMTWSFVIKESDPAAYISGQNIAWGAINAISTATQKQADWNETDIDDPSYIQNKPTIPTDRLIYVEYGDTDIDYDDLMGALSDNVQYVIYTTSGNYYYYFYRGVQNTWHCIVSSANNVTIINEFITSKIDATGKVSWSPITVQQISQMQSDWNVTDSSSMAYIRNKPSIPAAQVNSDWNASSGVAQILNKPSLATVATSGSYNDLSNKPTINNVPIPGTGEDGMVLTASYSGGVGTYAWAAAPAGTVTDVTVNGTSVVTQGVAAVTVPVIGTITL